MAEARLRLAGRAPASPARRVIAGGRSLAFALALLVVGFRPIAATAQSDGVLQVDDGMYTFVLRMQTAGFVSDAFLTTQPLAVHMAQAALDSIASREGELSQIDRRLLNRFRGAPQNEALERIQSTVPFFYANGVDFFSLTGDGYRVQLNPLLNVNVGRARVSERPDGRTSVPVWQSTRGARASGSFADAVFFEARLEENQRRVIESGFNDFRQTAPRLGKVNLDADREVLDYLVATGLVGYRSRFFEVRFGRDRNRWGEGLGSVTLSNYATVYDQLQLRTTFGPVQYTNLFSSLATGRVRANDSVIPKKYAAMHRLSVKLPYRFEVALTESVIFGTDSLGARKSFDVSYLNPVIFLRAVEADRGSPDNVLLGAAASWIPIAGYRVYGELFLDELRVPEIGNKWWANKWAVQWGFLAVPHPALDVRVEYTRLRPYLYAHRDPLNAYVHYDDGVGHPAGPNAIDWLVELHGRPTDRLQTTFTFYRTVRGRDSTGTNFGSDPTLSNTTRERDTGVEILQGIRQVELQMDFLASFELLPRLFADARLTWGRIDDDVTGRDQFVRPLIGLRWGLTPLSSRY